MNFTVVIDTLKLQIDFTDSSNQREVMNSITKAICTTFPFLMVKYDTNTKRNATLTHSVYSAGKTILKLTSGAYQDSAKNTIYFITVEIAGLKQYSIHDEIAHNCLVRIVAYFNTNTIDFFYTGIDIAVDMLCPFAYTYGFCNKKAPHVNYYQVYEPQHHTTTHYIEKYHRTHNRVMKRAYLYDKSIKENSLIAPITRFELKLQPRFFHKNAYMLHALQSELDRYHILYFATLEEKDIALWLYAQHEQSIRRRDLHKLGLDRYRIYPDTSEIERFLFSLYDIYESDLDLPVAVTDNGFDWDELL